MSTDKAMVSEAMVEAAAKAACEDNVDRIHRKVNERGGSNSMSGSEFYAYPPTGWPDFLASMRAAISAALAQAEQPVAVKPLEWADLQGCQNGTTKRFMTVEAKTPFTRLIVEGSSMGEWFWSENMRFPHAGPFDDEETAKAAAEADYERRILSALAHPPAKREAGETAPAPVQHVVPVPALWAECAYCKEIGEEECLHPVDELRWNGEQWCCEECGAGEEPDLWQASPQIVIPAPVSTTDVSGTPSAALEASHE